MRADAARNREHIVTTARGLFRSKGLDAVSMDEVAKAAGVGPGTLYRHFPTKDALYDAALEAWGKDVNAAVDHALETNETASDRLDAWLSAYAHMLLAHKGAAARLTAALGDPDSAYAAKCSTWLNANQRLIDAMGADLRDDVTAMQICRLVGGIAAVADSSELPTEAVQPLLDVVAAGLLRG